MTERGLTERGLKDGSGRGGEEDGTSDVDVEKGEGQVGGRAGWGLSVEHKGRRARLVWRSIWGGGG